MKFLDVSYEEFIQKTKYKKIIQFGASSAWHHYQTVFTDIQKNVVNNTVVIVDNDKKKWGTDYYINDKKFVINNPETIKAQKDIVILITVSLAYQKDICKQLCNFELSDDVECYSLPLMSFSKKKCDNSCVDTYFKNRNEKKIPPIIHSFWFSGDKKPELYERCMESWHKHCPEFKIIEWNKDNYDVNKNVYMKQAIDAKKWAFASDFARLDVLLQYGGIYMDMDVELVGSLDKLLYANRFFCRQEDGILELGSGFGVQPADDLIKKMLKTYDNRKLILDNGLIDMTPQPEWLSSILSEQGIVKNHNSQIIEDTIIFSNDYITCFSGDNFDDTAKIGIHWHNGGWLDKKDRDLIHDSLSVKQELIEKYFI
jgi:mannosyltransferase OCH1-like enzyme